MKEFNETSVTEFILLGITNIPELQSVLFVTFFILYLFSSAGNLSIVMVVVTDRNLHTPMYFFLGNLSFLDFFYSSTTVPKMLSGLLFEDKRISFRGCIAQLHMFHLLGSVEAMLLTIMSYDRYLAICIPLRYHVLMGKTVYIQLTFISWLLGLLYSLSHTIMTSRLPFCNTKVAHFFCDLKPLLKFSCTDTHINESLVTIITGSVALGTFVLIVISYSFIASHLQKIRSDQGRNKALSTCSSHLTVVLLYYGTGFCTYLRPANKDTLEQDRMTAVLFTVITPALNPIIYTLRNKEVKRSLRKLLMHHCKLKL